MGNDKNNIEEIIADMCTIKIFRINKINHPWVTAPLIELIKDKDIALKNGKMKKDEDLWKQAQRVCNICTNRLKALLHFASGLRFGKTRVKLHETRAKRQPLTFQNARPSSR